MNALSSILLSLLLTVSSVGMTIQKHYCGNRLSEVSILLNATCGCDDKDENDRCCHDETQTIQLDCKVVLQTLQDLPDPLATTLLANAFFTLIPSLEEMPVSQLPDFIPLLLRKPLSATQVFRL